MNDLSGWDGILDHDETIVWQGRPDDKVTFKPAHIFSFIFGAFFAGFALFWMVMASAVGGNFWMFGLIHFTVGLGVMLGPIFWPAWSRRHTWYTLTDQRAFIATDLPMLGRKLKSYPIEHSTRLDYQRGVPASIFFATEYRRTKNGSRKIPIGFERIDDGDQVYGLFREVQSRAK